MREAIRTHQRVVLGRGEKSAPKFVKDANRDLWDAALASDPTEESDA